MNHRNFFVVLSLLPCLFLLLLPALHAQNNRLWATYYGGAGNEFGYSTATDAAGNVYLAGNTVSISGIASGGFQNTFGGNQDAFLVKFDAAGNRLWATYYGGTGWEYGNSVAADAAGNVYLCGGTSSTSGIASGGFQNTYGGGNMDAFLVKFDAAGNRIWATYYGGSTGTDWAYSVCADGASNIFLAGMTESPSGIASGGFQNTYAGGVSSGYGDLFLVKFNSAGNRLWATYYGGAGDEYTPAVGADATGNVFLSGSTTSTSGISSGGFQNAYGGGAYDGMLVKFNSAGARLWGTYYGGAASDFVLSIAIDLSGNVLVSGVTASTSAISASGFQNSYGGGGWDAFLTKFDPAGARVWSTYYGGSGDEWGVCVATDASSNIFLGGNTNSSSNISFGGFQNTNAGGWTDAMLIKFDAAGSRLCATYYGGSAGATGNDGGNGIATDASGNVYLAGATDNTSNISSGGFQNVYGGGTGSGFAGDAMLVKFTSCFNNILTATSAASGIVCNGQCTGTATVSPTGGTPPYTYAWSSSHTSSAATGLCAGNYSVLVTDAAAGTVVANVVVSQPTAITVTVTSTSASCGTSNGSASATVNGGTSPYTYNWSNGSTAALISNLSPQNYSVTITDANGCTQTQSVTVTAGSTFSLAASSSPASCNNNNGTATAIPGGGVSPFTYSWSTIPPQASATATGLSPGTYTVNVTDSGGCTSSQTVAVGSAPSLTLSASSSPAGCTVNNGAAFANASGGSGPYTYLWNNGQTASAATALGVGNYTVVVTDASGCTAVTIAGVASVSGLTASASALPLTISQGASSTLSSAGGTTYVWSPATALSCVTCISPVASPSQTTQYCVSVSDTNGCSDSTCVTVFVDVPELPCGTIYIPNAFSPNNDLENDFECVMGDCIESMHLVIYDRWGEKVFESKEQAVCWDGTYRNKPLNPAVFSYFLDVVLTSGEQIRKKGNVSIVR